jgi:hypothetical protein
MDIRDNQGRGQIEYKRGSNGNTIDTNTTCYAGRPVVQLITTRDNQGRVESRTVLGGKLLP